MTTTTRTHALTFLGPLAPRRLWWCRLVLPILRLLAMSLSPLARLRFIHFAGWIVFDDLPGTKTPGWRPRPSMLFVSDYDGDPTEYLAAFGLGIPGGMQWSFGATDGFPGPRPTRPFVEYVERYKQLEILRYSAYPGATARDIDAALAVSECMDKLRRSADEDNGNEAFAACYATLLDALTRAPEQRAPSFLTGLWRGLWSRSSVRGLTTVMPIKAGRETAARTTIGALARQTPSTFDQVPGLHFARVAAVRVPGRCDTPSGTQPDHLLFSAWFDGKVDDFADRLVNGLGGRGTDAIWADCAGYPGATEPETLAAWITSHGLPTSFFLGSVSGISVDQIQRALALREQAFKVAAASQGRPLPEIRRELKRLWT